MRLRIIGTDGLPCADFVAGEIQLQTSCLFEGYWDRNGFRRDVFTQDGWYRTGDFGFTANEEVFVIGRMKDIIIVAGQNIFPEDVEIITSQVAGVYPGRVVAFASITRNSEHKHWRRREMSGEFDSTRSTAWKRNQSLIVASLRLAPRFVGVVSATLDRQEHSRQNIAPRYSQPFLQDGRRSPSSRPRC
jgi:acyl-CoA synthetase (AMP-forming)/AMP-acid ligase II